MPNIKGIDLSNGIIITRANGTTYQVTEADIVSYLQSHSIEQTEQQVVTWMNSNVFADQNDQCAIKILSVSPLDYRFIVAINNYSEWDEILQEWVTKQYVIPDGWWL